MIEYLPLLILFIPLLSATLTVWAPNVGAYRTRLRLGTLFVTLVLLGVVGTRPTGILEIPFWGDIFPVAQSLRFSYDRLAFVCGLALMLGLISGDILQNAQTGERQGPGPTATLLVASAGLAIISAASLATLCLAWVALDLIMFWAEARTAYRSRRTRGGRALVIRTLSAGMLIAAGALLLAEQGDTALPLLLPGGIGLYLLMASAVLRMAAYPLPGSLRGLWYPALASLITGAYMWLRTAQMGATRFPSGSWPAALAAMSLLLTALLAGAGSQQPHNGRYLCAHWVSLIVLAPLLDATSGIPISLGATLTGALAAVSLVADTATPEPADRLRLITRAALLACAGGVPLTVGFVARWALLRLLWTQAQGAMFGLVLVACILASWPTGRQLAHLVRPNGAARPPRAFADHALGIAPLTGPALLFLLALVPGLLERATPQLVGRLTLPSPRALLANGGQSGGWGVLAAALLPVVCSIGGMTARGDPLTSLVGSPSALQAFLELEWLYSQVERALSWLQTQACRGLALLEGSLALGWMFVWLVVALLYLTGG